MVGREQVHPSSTVGIICCRDMCWICWPVGSGMKAEVGVVASVVEEEEEGACQAIIADCHLLVQVVRAVYESSKPPWSGAE